MACSFDFTGRRVLVTGGSRGIGLGIVKKFLEFNATVIAVARDEASLAELKKNFPKVEVVSTDLTDWEATTKALESVLPIHHLVNNAGIANPVRFLDVKEEDIDSVMTINFKSCLHVSQIVAKRMIADGIENGTIVNISTCGDRVLSRVNSAAHVYSCSKAALFMLTRIMASELFTHGIRVTCVRPGGVMTEIFETLPQEKYDTVVGNIAKLQLHGRMITTEEVANAVVFLSSHLASMITGSALTVDGGYDLV